MEGSADAWPGASEGIAAGATDHPNVGFADGGKEGFNDGGDAGLMLGFMDGTNAGAGDDPDDAIKGTLDGLISIPEI
jgi:hypothetical protein